MRLLFLSSTGLRPPSAEAGPERGGRSSGRRSTSGSERGIALVITLILLSVITFMAVTFLVLSRSEKGAVTTAMDQEIAQNGVDEANEQAKARLVSLIMAFTNPYAIDTIVSTNYLNPAGFETRRPAYFNPTNVN